MIVADFRIYKIVLLVFYCTDSEPYENIYGESPKYVVKEEQGDAEDMAIWMKPEENDIILVSLQ